MSQFWGPNFSVPFLDCEFIFVYVYVFIFVFVFIFVYVCVSVYVYFSILESQLRVLIFEPLFCCLSFDPSFGVPVCVPVFVYVWSPSSVS